jgi:hypothetical protein
MLVLMPIISKYLAPSDFGQFVLAQVYASVAVGIANLGVLVGYERNFFIFAKSLGAKYFEIIGINTNINMPLIAICNK